MKGRILQAATIFLLIFSLCACSLSEKGSSLFGFSERMDKLCENIDFTAEGFLYSQEENGYIKYFESENAVILLKLMCNEKQKITAMHIVFDGLSEKNTAEIKFIKNLIISFVDNPETSAQIINDEDFYKDIFQESTQTKMKKFGSIDLLIDTTEVGTVITLVHNIP